MFCIKCKEPLIELPVYNNSENDVFPPSFLQCMNKECDRNGLLSTVFMTKIVAVELDEKNKKNKRKKI
jgi:hypothetical protein